VVYVGLAICRVIWPAHHDSQGKQTKSMAQKPTLLMLYASLHGLNHALQVALPPMYLAIKNDFGLEGLGSVMLFGTVYLAVYALMNLPFGFMVDRFSKKNLLAAGGLINSLAFVLAATAQSYEVFMAAMVLAGLGGGAYHPAGNALIASLFKGRLGRALGLVGSGAAVGLFGGPALAGYLCNVFDWRTACLAFAGLGVAICLAFWLAMPDEPPRPGRQKSQPLSLKALAAPALVMMVIFCLREFSLWGIKFTSAPMSQMTLGFSSDRAGLLMGMISIMGIVSQPVGGALSDRFGRGKTLFWALLVTGPLFALLPHMGPVGIFVVAGLAGLFMFSTIPVLEAAVADMVPEEGRGRVFGLMLTIGVLVAAVSPYVTGTVFDLTGSYLVPYLMLGGLCTFAGVMALRMPSKQKQPGG
jgi:FSR family fosmidomycin resistance protein-like MFS transporter